METARNTQVTKRVCPGTDCAEEAIKATEISPHVFMRKVGLIFFWGGHCCINEFCELPASSHFIQLSGNF